MLKNFFLTAILLFSIFLFIKIVEPLSVTCMTGGPYIKNSTYNTTINVAGSVTDGGGVAANVSANITKAGVVWETKNTTSDASGQYILSINKSFDVGTYAINISAEKDGSYAYCGNTTQVGLLPSTGCLNRNIQVSGTAVYPSTGLTVTSGTARLSIYGETASNQSSVTDGQFSTILPACLTAGKRYILQTYIDDNAGKKSWSYMFINW